MIIAGSPLGTAIIICHCWIYLRGKVVCAGFEPLCVNLDQAPEGIAKASFIFTFLDSLCIDPASGLTLPLVWPIPTATLKEKISPPINSIRELLKL